MQLPKTIAFIILTASLLMGCNSNNATNAAIADATNNTSSSSGSGDDYYYEFTTNSSGKSMSINEVTKMFVSSKGDMRSEMSIRNSANGNKASAPIIIIAHATKPGERIDIDDSTKTYTINRIDSSELNDGEKINSIATKVGNEKILGFNCVHAKVISKKTMGSFYATTDTLDLWKSDDVPQQPSVKKLMNRFESGKGNALYSTEAAEQLKQMGCDGFLVKMVMSGKDVSMTMQLTKAARRSLDASMFQIPSGYKEEKE